MTQGASVWLVLVVAVIAANLPFVNERLFELVVFALLTWGLGVALEGSIGQRARQDWEFYAAGACLFLTLASPGFIWRYLRRHRPPASNG